MPWLHVICQWAWSDRIRTFQREGKLLRLRVGACVRVRGRAAQVTAIAVTHKPSTHNNTSGADSLPLANVEYTCRSAAGGFRLRVRPACASPSTVRVWIQPLAVDASAAGCLDEEELDVADVEVFG
jgi:hypothetical protein